MGLAGDPHDGSLPAPIIYPLRDDVPGVLSKDEVRGYDGFFGIIVPTIYD